MIDVYYVEDDGDIAQTVREYLERQGCRVAVFGTISDAKKALAGHIPTIILIDWNMPDGHGDTLCRLIRSRWKELPIIFLTVRGDSRDIVSGFQSGADDYVIKPFELEVLYSRICALLRRTGSAQKQYLSCGCISIDKKRLTAFYGREELNLSPAEYRLLLLFLENKGMTLTRERILENIWDSCGSYVNDNTLTVTIKRLREKLHQPSCLKTVRSVGYRMEDIE